MKPLIVPESYNYIAIFLTLGCQLKCSYCINIQNYDRGTLAKERKAMTAKDWIAALNRIEATEDMPLSIQGGEPTSHREFYEIISNVHRPMDLLTNAQFDIDHFCKHIDPKTFRRSAPYASIRISFHPEQMDLTDTVDRVVTLHNRGYQVGVWMVEVPEQMHIFSEAKYQFQKRGIDFRGKELLGEHNGKIYGHFKYPHSVDEDPKNYKECLCRTTELLVAPDGSIHRCHSDLYNLRQGIGHVLDEAFVLDRTFRTCSVYGSCSGCDVKVKTNRFQQHGHTSVEILNRGEQWPQE